MEVAVIGTKTVIIILIIRGLYDWRVKQVSNSKNEFGIESILFCLNKFCIIFF